MSETTQTTCVRHPDTPTRLSCSECGTPICPRCLIDTPVGQKCPACARQKRSARRQGKPQQYVKGYGAGLVAAVAAAFLLSTVYGQVRFFTWILTGFVGYGIGRAVLWGAENNRADPFRYATLGLGVGAAALGWVMAGAPIGAVVTNLTPIGSLLAAAYGGWIALHR